ELFPVRSLNGQPGPRLFAPVRRCPSRPLAYHAPEGVVHNWGAGHRRPMKYAIIIPDGCADEPQPSLGGRTPLQAAHKPNMDRLAQGRPVRRAQNGCPPRSPARARAKNGSQPWTPASDVATLSLFGYDPLQVYTGRARLETAAMGIALGPND